MPESLFLSCTIDFSVTRHFRYLNQIWFFMIMSDMILTLDWSIKVVFTLVLIFRKNISNYIYKNVAKENKLSLEVIFKL